MMALNPIAYYPERFEVVKEGLGIGRWKKDESLLKFRDIYASLLNEERSKSSSSTGGQGFVIVETPWRKGAFEIGIGQRCQEKDRLMLIDGVVGDASDSVRLHGVYVSASEFLKLPDHLMASRELNGYVPGRTKSGLQ